MADVQKSQDRILARGLARELSMEEVNAVGGGMQQPTITGETWVTVNGDWWIANDA